MKRFGVGVDTEDADFLADADSSSDTGKTIKDTNVELFVSAWPNQSTAVHVALGIYNRSRDVGDQGLSGNLDDVRRYVFFF